MTYSKPYRTASYDRAVEALQVLLKEEGPAQVYRACGDAVAYLQQTPPPTETAGTVEKMPEGPLLLNMKEAAKRLGISSTFLYHLVARGEIASVKLGSRRKIPNWALTAYILRLVEQQGIDISHGDLPSWELPSTRGATNSPWMP